MAHKLPNAVKLIIIYFLTRCGADFTCNINDQSDCSCAKIVGPVSTTVLSNTDVNLRCTVPDAYDNEVQWIQSVPGDQPNPLGIDPTIPCCPRYSMNTVGGNYSLTISNVTVSDQGSYFCQIPDCTKSSNTAELTVYILPTGPTIQNEVNGYVNVIASETQNWLVCSATNAKPAAIVRWYDMQSGMLLDADSATTTIPNANQAYDTTASYSFQPTAADNETQYTCQISGDAVSLSGVPYINEIITIFVTDQLITTTLAAPAAPATTNTTSAYNATNTNTTIITIPTTDATSAITTATPTANATEAATEITTTSRTEATSSPTTVVTPKPATNTTSITKKPTTAITSATTPKTESESTTSTIENKVTATSKSERVAATLGVIVFANLLQFMCSFNG